MTTSITFWGAAGQVTGSCHLLEWPGHRVLLDCGLFQDKREESTRLNAALPFDPRQLDGVILSHAHIDHSGRLPLLAGHQFNHGDIAKIRAGIEKLNLGPIEVQQY